MSSYPTNLTYPTDKLCICTIVRA